MNSESATSASSVLAADADAAVSLYGWKALAASAIGYAMDGFDLLMLGFMLAAISVELGLSSAQAGSLITWTLFGAVVGGVIFGVLSDRCGRVRILMWTILIFAGFTGLCAFARGYWDLVAYRTLAGVGLGGEFGIGMTLAAEAWPASRRARVSSYVALGWQAGVLLAALITPWLLPRIGWRGMFLVGLAPALVAFLVRRALDEPEIFVRHRAINTDRHALRLLLKDANIRRTTLGIAVLCAVQIFGYYGLMIWMPSYLASRLGFNLTRSGLWTAATVLGMAAGIWIFGQLADRIGRKPIFILFQSGAAVMVFVYSWITNPVALLWVGAIMGMAVNGMMAGIPTLMSEAYPTAVRATAQNVLFNLGRALGATGPLVVGSLVARYSFQAGIAMLASIYLIAIVATVLLIPELRGRRLE
jgi:MFS family permease